MVPWAFAAEPASEPVAELPMMTVTTKSCSTQALHQHDSAWYECLNIELNERVRAIESSPVISAGSSDNLSIASPVRQGVFNEAATRLRLGNAFGRSVIPQRPTMPASTHPLIP